MISPRTLIHLAGGLTLVLALLTAWGCVEIDTSVDFNNDGTVGNFTEPEFFAEETVAVELPVVNHMRIRLETISGDIEIEGQIDAHSVIVTAQKWVGSDRMEDAEVHLQELETRVTAQNDEILIQTLQPENTENREYQVDYHITLPSNLEIEVTHVNGDIVVQDTESPVWVDSTNSHVFLSNIFGNVDVNLSNGSINSTMALPVNGEIRFSTGNGNLDLSIPTSTSAMLAASVVNGFISVSSLEFDGVQTTQSLTGTLGNGEGVIELGAVNGNISVIGLN